MTAVKLCGTASEADLALAVRLEADYVGFVFAESPRRVEPRDAGAWRQPPSARPPRRVGVFVDAPRDAIAEAVAVARLDLVQLHGDETPEECARIAALAPVIKAVRMTGPESLPELDRYAACFALLVEPRHPEKRGGAGVPLDLALAARASEGRRVFLAGGLAPETVAAAIRAARPFAVDVASGIEARPGVKDPERAERFVLAARAASANGGRP